MTDVRASAGGQEVKIYSSGDAAPQLTPTPVVVSSGMRPLQISSSSAGGANIVDGAAAVKSPSTPITVFPAAAAAAATPVKVAPSSSSIVIRSGSSAVAQQPTPPTSPSTAATFVNGVSSGITIRSSVSAVAKEGDKIEPSATVAAATGPSAVTDQISSADSASGSRTITVNQGITIGGGHMISTGGYPSAPSKSPSPSESTTATSAPQISTSSSVIDQRQTQQQKQHQVLNDVRQASPEVVDAAPSSSAQTTVIRAQTLTAGRSRPRSAVVEQPQQPPMTWSEFFNRFDLFTICSFTLAVFAIAFASILAGDDLPFVWLLTGISVASIALFVKLRL